MISWNKRQQHWIVSQRNFQWILETNQRRAPNGVPVLVAWAIEMRNTVQSKWLCRVVGDFILWLLMPSIMFTLCAEAELGEYFEEKYAWHCQSGPFYSMSGFCMKQIHYLYIRFELPWFNLTCFNLWTRMKKTIAYIEANFQGAEKET